MVFWSAAVPDRTIDPLAEETSTRASGSFRSRAACSRFGVQGDLEIGGADHVSLLVEQHDAGDATLRAEHHERTCP